MDERVLVINSKILVRLQDGEMRSHGGIILPDNADKPVQFGYVTEVGDGYPQLDPDYDSAAPPGSRKSRSQVAHVPLKVKHHDLVFFYKGTGAAIDLEGTKYVVLEENNVLLIKRQEF